MGIPNFILKIVIVLLLIYIAKQLYDIAKAVKLAQANPSVTIIKAPTAASPVAPIIGAPIQTPSNPTDNSFVADLGNTMDGIFGSRVKGLANAYM